MDEWEKFVEKNEHIIEIVQKRRHERDVGGKLKEDEPKVEIKQKGVQHKKTSHGKNKGELLTIKSPSETTVYSRAVESSSSNDESSDNSFEKLGNDRLSILDKLKDLIKCKEHRSKFKSCFTG